MNHGVKYVTINRMCRSITIFQIPQLSFLNLYANVQRAKRDTVTADIYYYITTEFGYAKRDLHAAYGGVVLQRFEFEGSYGEKR